METKSKPKIQIPKSIKRSSSSNSESLSHLDSPYSPLRFHSPLRSDLGNPPPETPPYLSPINSPGNTHPPSSPPPTDNSKAIVVAVDKFTQCSPSLTPPLPPAGKKAAADAASDSNPREKEDGTSAVRKIAELGFRISEVVLCLISFSVMAADKTQGWSGDSFDRYKEYRYCLSVNVIAFAYSGFQAYDLGFRLVTGKHVIRHHLRRHFNFFMDQALAYLLLSASSSAATQVDNWQSNWGKDEFTEMASASIAMAFLAFVAFAASSVIAGYNLCSSHD